MRRTASAASAGGGARVLKQEIARNLCAASSRLQAVQTVTGHWTGHNVSILIILAHFAFATLGCHVRQSCSSHHLLAPSSEHRSALDSIILLLLFVTIHQIVPDSW